MLQLLHQRALARRFKFTRHSGLEKRNVCNIVDCREVVGGNLEAQKARVDPLLGRLSRWVGNLSCLSCVIDMTVFFSSSLKLLLK